MNKGDFWIGAYYPDSVLSQPRARTILCLLFDKIICNFPITSMDCEGGSGVTEFFNDSPLVEVSKIQGTIIRQSMMDY